MRAAAKFLLGRALAAASVRRVLTLRYGGIGSIFVLHRVVPEPDRSVLSLNRGLEVTPQQLAELIGRVRARGYRVGTLDDMLDRLEKPDPSAPRLCVFSFDDGYRDNLTYALPIFERLEAPMSVFVTTDFADHRVILWWYALERALLAQDHLDLEIDGETRHIDAGTPEAKNRAFESIRSSWMGLPREALLASLESIGFGTGALSALTRDLALDWDGVRMLARHPLVTIGAHAVTHRQLTALTDAELLAEISGAKARIEAETGVDVRYFCYPFGDAASASAREFAAVAQAGYRAALTTRIGNIVSRHAQHTPALPRIPVDGCSFSFNALEYMMSGAQAVRQRRFSSLVYD